MRAIIQGLTDAEFERLYGTEEQCLAAWVKVRQDAGMPCSRCGNPKSYVYDRRVGCTRCDMRWSITSGTVMADTKAAANHLVSRHAPDEQHQAVHLRGRTRPPVGRQLSNGVVSAQATAPRDDRRG
jgi:hypothetical protein